MYLLFLFVFPENICWIILLSWHWNKWFSDEKLCLRLIALYTSIKDISQVECSIYAPTPKHVCKYPASFGSCNLNHVKEKAQPSSWFTCHNFSYLPFSQSCVLITFSPLCLAAQNSHPEYGWQAQSQRTGPGIKQSPFCPHTESQWFRQSSMTSS